MRGYYTRSVSRKAVIDELVDHARLWDLRTLSIFEPFVIFIHKYGKCCLLLYYFLFLLLQCSLTRQLLPVILAQRGHCKPGCKGPTDCLYANPKDSTRFIQCNNAGTAYDTPCAPGGLHWNDGEKNVIGLSLGLVQQMIPRARKTY
jgi:hypothetical protein